MEDRIDVYADVLADIALIYEAGRGGTPEQKANYFESLGPILARLRDAIQKPEVVAA